MTNTPTQTVQEFLEAFGRHDIDAAMALVDPQASVTVTNPGPQNSPANTAIAPLQITANDSAGNTLTFSATGLPAGLSISTTGMITGMPTQVGPNSVTVTALTPLGTRPNPGVPTTDCRL